MAGLFIRFVFIINKSTVWPQVAEWISAFINCKMQKHISLYYKDRIQLGVKCHRRTADGTVAHRSHVRLPLSILWDSAQHMAKKIVQREAEASSRHCSWHLQVTLALCVFLFIGLPFSWVFTPFYNETLSLRHILKATVVVSPRPRSLFFSLTCSLLNFGHANLFLCRPHLSCRLVSTIPESESRNTVNKTI